MLTENYSPGTSTVHTVKPVWKVASLCLFCTALFLWESWLVLTAAAASVIGLYLHARISLHDIVSALRPALWMLGLIFALQLYLVGWDVAAFVVLRFAVMILAASLLTLTTPASDLISSIENSLKRIFPAVVSEAVGLAFSLCFRFIPLVRRTFEEVCEAQKARGLERSWRALITPTVIRTLKSADEVAQAIAARSIDTSHLSGVETAALNGEKKSLR